MAVMVRVERCTTQQRSSSCEFRDKICFRMEAKGRWRRTGTGEGERMDERVSGEKEMLEPGALTLSVSHFLLK